MLGSNFYRNVTATKAMKTRVTPLCPAPLLSDITLIIYMVLNWNETFSAKTEWKTHKTARPLEQFHLGALSSASFLQLFFSFFFYSSEFWPSFSNVNEAAQVARSGHHPARASFRAMIWRKQQLCCILTALTSPWVKTDEMCFLCNLDVDLFAFGCFYWQKKEKKKKEMDCRSSVKVFWTEGNVCNWGPWRESSLYVMKNYGWRLDFVRGLRLFSKHSVIYFSFLISNETGLHLLIAWTPHPLQGVAPFIPAPVCAWWKQLLL